MEDRLRFVVFLDQIVKQQPANREVHIIADNPSAQKKKAFRSSWLNRCRYRGDDGMKRWVGVGVIADNLINVGKILAVQGAEV
jgi:hypothetical protein